MNDFRFGPAEFYLVGFEGERPDPATFRALTDLIDSGVVRLLDFVVLSKSASGEVEIVELDDDDGDLGLDDFQPIAAGLAGEEDVEALAAALDPGQSAAVVVLELTFARALAQSLAAAGGQVLRSERVPAPVVNAMMDILDQEG
ncbi:DUF6325 family protein [Microbacterium aurugineum]|jgi:hypothetical protein|uniref:DUF1269 domain-containing family protein n=1 Tax=Microbacterium aurugineum TaxID=2851642 RepID=A0ABY4IZE1_9MICO|nr:MULTISPECIES: DUF6325 family protein [Microbacterium]MCK8466370.1 DUF6325 family protein [Microbacterium aurugineum]QEA29178.1 hypothetical protein FGL91_11800 [Microbacterium sp. CBA3102]TCJ24020.1 hypothetical protein E0W80_08940 [Microbacterium sp. PI-1]TFB17711.1 hypothetical protein E3V93_14305 [Microbacterium sp. 3H14]UPL18052.1 hypothetical protein KV397_09950 [Microbacterium aurugineum]